MGRKQNALRTPIDRRRFAQMCAGSLALAAVSCGRGKDLANDRGSMVTVASRTNPINPVEDSSNPFLVFLPLLSYTEKGELEGRLARTWEHSPDYREWTYHLRTDVRWHDGVPVTASDIKFTLELRMRPEVRDLWPGAFESITVHDDLTITIRSGHYHRYQTSAVVCYPKHLLERLDPKSLADWEFWTRPVGNGPYRFVRYQPETMMEFEANPDYYRGKPRIAQVVLKFSEQAGLTELLSGNVDAMSGNVARFPGGKLDPRFRVYYRYEDTNARMIYWQNKHPFFRDPRVRRALTLAINRRELLPLINVPGDTALVDGPYTLRQLRRGQLPAPLPYDPEQARALLEAAGWHDRDGDGVRERDGKAFSFTAIVEEPPYTEIATYVKDQFRRVGVQMDSQPLDNQSVHARLKSGEFEAAFAIFFSTYHWLQTYFGEHSPTGYENPAALALIQRAKVTADPDVEDRIYRELTDIFRTDAPATFLCPKVDFDFVHRSVRGLSSPWRADPVEFMEHLWLEDRSDR